MELEEILAQLKNPRNPYDSDLKALRAGLLLLLERDMGRGVETSIETIEEPSGKPKRGRKPKTEE